MCRSLPKARSGAGSSKRELQGRTARLSRGASRQNSASSLMLEERETEYEVLDPGEEAGRSLGSSPSSHQYESMALK